MRLNSRLRNFITGVMMVGLAGAITWAPAGDCTFHFDSVLQHTTGFGASTAWAGGLADNLINGLFSPTDGCGLTLMRMRIF